MVHGANKFQGFFFTALGLARVNLFDDRGIGIRKKLLRLGATHSAIAMVVPVDTGCHGLIPCARDWKGFINRGYQCSTDGIQDQKGYEEDLLREDIGQNT